MRENTFAIWPKDSRVRLRFIGRPEGAAPVPAVIVLPGGAYVALADREGTPVAERFAELGYAAFVLSYSTMYDSFEEAAGSPNPHSILPEPLWETAAAIGFIRENHERFGVDPSKIVLIGFSAGGHLAACFGCLWNRDEIYSPVCSEAENIKPNALVLCYPVTRLMNMTGDRMSMAMFGGDGSAAQPELDRYSPVLNVGSQTPPTFIWHSASDRTVPVRQSVDMFIALHEAGIPCEAHIFDSGPHATGLSEAYPSAPWPQLADAFLKRNI